MQKHQIWTQGLWLLFVCGALISSDNCSEALHLSLSNTTAFQNEVHAQILTRLTYIISITCTDLQVMSRYFKQKHYYKLQVCALARYYLNIVTLRKRFWKDCTEGNLWFYILLHPIGGKNPHITLPFSMHFSVSPWKKTKTWGLRLKRVLYAFSFFLWCVQCVDTFAFWGQLGPM